MRFESINDNSILTFALKGNGKTSQEKKFNEIMIPTSSYRMGVKRIGFGMAVLGKMGILTLEKLSAAVDLVSMLCHCRRHMV